MYLYMNIHTIVSLSLSIYIHIKGYYAYYSATFFVCLFCFLTVLGLRCYVWAFSSCGKRGLLFVVVHGLLVAVASLVAEHGL